MEQRMVDAAGEPADVQGDNPSRKIAAEEITISQPSRQTSISRHERRFNPRQLFWLTVMGIFLAEIIAMYVVSLIAPLSNFSGILLDAVVMTALVFPIVYFLSFRSLLAEINRSHHAEEALQHAHDSLEQRVEKRSEELRFALEMTQQRQTEVEALLQSARAILENREFHKSSRAIFDSIKNLIGASAGYVALVKGDINDPLFLDSGGYDCTVDPDLLMPIRGLRSQAYYQGKTVFENDFSRSEWHQFLPEGHAALSNVLFTPLIINEQVVGLIGLANKMSGFTDDDAIMASAFGEMAAIALINSQADQELRQARDEMEQRVLERTRELAEANQLLQAEIGERKMVEQQLQMNYAELLNLNSASQALTQTLDLETVINTLMDYMAKIVPCDSTSVILRESEALLTVRARRDGDQIQDSLNGPGTTFDAHSYPYLAEILENRKSILIADTAQYPDWQPNGASGQVRSWLGVPLVAGRRAIGLYSLEKGIPDFFTPEHIQLAETLVGQASTAIQNAWLYEQVRSGRERLQLLSRRLVEIQESERQYIAHELHDEAGQSLASLMVKLQMIEQGASQPQVVLKEVEQMEIVLQDVQESLHRLAMALRPASLDHLGLVSALRQHVETIGETHDLDVKFQASIPDQQLPGTVQTVLYRIVQEALTNIVRHAQASRVDVLLMQRQEQLVVIVEDDGIGFDWQEAMQKNRLGLSGMRERAEMIGGKLLIESEPGKSTTIAVEIPYDNSNHNR